MRGGGKRELRRRKGFQLGEQGRDNVYRRVVVLRRIRLEGKRSLVIPVRSGEPG